MPEAQEVPRETRLNAREEWKQESFHALSWGGMALSTTIFVETVASAISNGLTVPKAVAAGISAVAFVGSNRARQMTG